MTTVTRNFRAQAEFVGFVTRKIWRYDDQLYFRVAVPNRSNSNAAGARLSFFTIIVPRELSRSIRLEPGSLVSVIARPYSREYDETLARFLKFAKNAPQIDGAESVSITRIRTEFIAEALTIEPKTPVEQTAAQRVVERSGGEDSGASALE